MNNSQQLPEEYKETARFWNIAWGEELFETLPVKVQAELYDFEKMISTWSEVTQLITGGRLSYPNYRSQVLVTQWEDYVSEQIQNGVEEELAQAQAEAREQIKKNVQDRRKEWMKDPECNDGDGYALGYSTALHDVINHDLATPTDGTGEGK